MKIVDAELIIKIEVECPDCEDVIDLLELSSMTDDGYIHSRSLGDNGFGCKDFNETIICPECKNEFKIKDINY
jgi:uncharacterized protein YbaR (Trm112 family)